MRRCEKGLLPSPQAAKVVAYESDLDVGPFLEEHVLLLCHRQAVVRGRVTVACFEDKVPAPRGLGPLAETPRVQRCTGGGLVLPGDHDGVEGSLARKAVRRAGAAGQSSCQDEEKGDRAVNPHGFDIRELQNAYPMRHAS